MTAIDKRLIELEATRGIAALVVLVHHLLLAFFPRFHGLLFPDEPVSLFGTPLFALVNGSAAVVLFFVLSGFVLTVRAFRTQSTFPLVLGALKRWPRLAVPVLAVNICAGLLAGWALYLNQPVAQEISSPWLSWWYDAPPAQWRSVVAAAKEGAFSTFLRGSAYFNSNLWTMYFEFYGSFLAFLVATIMIAFGSLGTGVLAAAMLFCFVTVSPYFTCFLAGVGLAALYGGERWAITADWLRRRGHVFWTAMLGLVVLLFGYHEALAPTRAPAGIYRFLTPLYELAPLHLRVALHTIGSMLVLLAVLALPAATSRLRGPSGAMLGRLSFPTYLLQVPVICIVGPALFVPLAQVIGATAALVAAAVASGSATLVLAIPLMRLEAAWLGILRDISHKPIGPLLRRGRSLHHP